MGMFSFMRADNCTQQRNFVANDSIKMLIPKEFGGCGYIKGQYDGYGHIIEKNGDTHDIYEIVAVMNRNYIDEYVNEENPYTTKDGDRKVGINIACYDEEHKRLKYPIKLVSVRYTGAYEDLDTFSKSDPNQGFRRIY